MREFGPLDRNTQWIARRERRREAERKKMFSRTRSAFFALMSLSPSSIADDLTRVLEHETLTVQHVSTQAGKPTSIEDIVTASERQEALDNAIVAIQKNLQDPEVLRALEGEGEDPLLVISSAMEVPILPPNLLGTDKDVTELHQNYTMRIKTKYGFANGVRWDNGDNENNILTAAHVSRGPEWASTVDSPGIDVDIYHPSPPESTSEDVDKQVLFDDPSVMNADVHGQFVVIVGVDPDKTSDEYGHKTYPGVAIKLSSGLAEKIAGSYKNMIQRLKNSFMLFLPPGEARPPDQGRVVSTTEFGGQSLPKLSAGMSGSDVEVWIDGKYNSIGVFWGSMCLNDNVHNRCIDVGFFHGPEERRRALDHKE